MKNKLYAALFAVAASSCITVSAQNESMKNVWGGTVETDKAPDWSKIVKHDKPNTLGAIHSASHNLGENPATYAPSEEENFLRHLASTLQGLNPEYAMQLQDIAHEIAQLRMHDLEVFTKYFKSEVMSVTATMKLQNSTIPDLGEEKADKSFDDIHDESGDE